MTRKQLEHKHKIEWALFELREAQVLACSPETNDPTAAEQLAREAAERLMVLMKEVVETDG